MRRIIIVVCLVASGAGVSSTALAATGPRGSVVLSVSALKKAGTTQCGKVKGVWISGKVTKIKSKNYFVSHSKSSQFYSADARKARGAKKKKLQKLSSDFKKKSSLGDKRCSRFNVSVPGATTPPAATTLPTATTAPVGAQELKFDINNAVALMMSSSSVSSASTRKKSLGSNLQTLDQTGKTKDAVVSGRASIKRYLIAPNDKLYIEFSDAPTIGGAPCLLAEVSKDTGLPVCIERDTGFVIIPAGQSKSQWGLTFRPLVNDIQFDSDGNVYYLGTPSTWKQQFPGLTCLDTGLGGMAGQVVRKFSNGTTTDIGSARFVQGTAVRAGFTGDYSKCVIIEHPIDNFLVFKNGGVLIDQSLEMISKGLTGPNGSPGWAHTHRLDYWSKEGLRTEIEGFPFSGTMVKGERTPFGFMRIMNQQAILLGWSDMMYQVDLGNMSLSVPKYLGRSSGDASFAIEDLGCRASSGRLTDFDTYFCEVGGTTWRASWETPEGKVFAVSGQDPYSSVSKADSFYEQFVSLGGFTGAGLLFQVWPTVDLDYLAGAGTGRILKRIETFLPILDSIVACGLGTDGERRTVLYGTTTKTAVELIPSSLNISVSKFAYTAKTNSIIFSGIRNTDNVAILGTVNVNTKVLSVLKTGQTITDLQGFSS